MTSKLVWLAVSGLAAVALAAIPTPAGLSPAGQRTLAITLLAAHQEMQRLHLSLYGEGANIVAGGPCPARQAG